MNSFDHLGSPDVIRKTIKQVNLRESLQAIVAAGFTVDWIELHADDSITVVSRRLIFQS